MYFPLLRTVGQFFLKQLTLWANKRGSCRRVWGVRQIPFCFLWIILSRCLSLLLLLLWWKSVILSRQPTWSLVEGWFCFFATMANHHEIILVGKYYCTVLFPQNPLTQTLQIHISESKPANLFLTFFLNSCNPYINGPAIVSGLIPWHIYPVTNWDWVVFTWVKPISFTN